MGTKFPPAHRLSMAQQIGRMHNLHPRFERSWRRGSVRWIGPIQPTDTSNRYKVAISYTLGLRPIVRVLSPHLEDRSSEEPVPHCFRDDSLCLYLTNSGEWTPGDYVAETTVPWTSEWLYFYEVWRATGEWLGGGVHPPPKRKRGTRNAGRCTGP